MKLKFFSTAAILLSLVFVQCKKDSGGDNNPPAETPKDYAALSVGSTFTFRDITATNLLVDTSDYTLTVTNNDTVAFGKTYRKLTGSDTSVRYRAKVGANYYQLASLGGFGIAAFEDNYLNDSLAVNATWNTTTPEFSLPGTTYQATAKLVYKIGSTGGTLTVNGNNYTNVIKVELSSLTVTPSAFPIPITINATGNYYYAKGYGLIQGDLNVPNQTLTPFPGVSFTIPKYSLSQKLTASNIK